MTLPCLYTLVYLILITLKTHKLIKNSIVLKYDNDILLINLEISNKKLAQAATHDPLTKIPNRRLFQTNLANALARARKNSRILALLYIDLDNFKTVNDLYGHQTGDRILQIMINRLRNYFRKDDILARLGGDELAVIIENVNGHEDIETIARKICYLIAIPVKLQNATLQISASVGISVYPDDGADEESLLKCADTCMYYAKEHGGNKFYFSEKLTT
ncbi:Cyclic di-GMP phosphodiesterase Gmr [Aquicella siphonis]|uniref:Cyclic di-GMP phosphodiesterase Gmr n=1 Tax=Aquicella siphonis TaxID=254247 RepID=A0A5E4PGY0_9COXI|nr:Cyclic di-GMP phosphodiesterase Gmr [Aquicella siphonis]